MLAVSAVWFEGWKTTFVVGYTQKLIRGFQPLMGFWYTIIWRNEALLGSNVKGIRLDKC